MHRSVVLKLGYLIVFFSSILVNGHLIRHKREVCQSEECQKVSDYILSKLDTRVSPCDDMYQFSCGRWPDANKIAPYRDYSLVHEVHYNNDKQLFLVLQEEEATFRCKNSSAITKLKDFYQSCVNSEDVGSKAVLPLTEFIDSYGSWTVSKTRLHWDEEHWNVEEALSKAHKLWGTSFWTTSMDQDLKNPLRNIIYFQQSGLTMPESVKNYCDKKYVFMNKAIFNVELLGGDQEIIKEKMSSVFDLEKQLAQINVPLESVRNPVSSYNLMTLGEFQRMLGSWIDIEDYMEGYFGSRVLTLDDEVVVKTPDYFSKLGTIIQETSKETLANYVMWNLVHKALQNHPMMYSNSIVSLSNEAEMAQIEELNENTDSSGDGDDKDPKSQKVAATFNPRHGICIMRAKAALPFLTSALFVDKSLSIETITKIVTAIDDIEHVFVQELQENKWLDDKTRKILIEKAKSMSNQVGYPDWILNPEKLDAKYEKLVIEKDDFLKNVIRITEFDREQKLGSYSKPPERKQWRISPDRVNAYHSNNDNEMVILAGVLQSPIVSPYYPRSFMFGGIGTFLGHELIHGFDNKGRLFNKDGVLGDTWTPHVAEEFNKRAQCFIDQYSSYSVYNISLNGRLTLGENIADNGGMKMSYKAYQSSINPHDFSLPGLEFTDEQLFFIGMSQFWCAQYSRQNAINALHNQVHALNRFRVIGTMTNSKEFAEAFKCAKNTPMNPEKKCELW